MLIKFWEVYIVCLFCHNVDFLNGLQIFIQIFVYFCSVIYLIFNRNMVWLCPLSGLVKFTLRSLHETKIHIRSYLEPDRYGFLGTDTDIRE